MQGAKAGLEVHVLPAKSIALNLFVRKGLCDIMDEILRIQI